MSDRFTGETTIFELQITEYRALASIFPSPLSLEEYIYPESMICLQLPHPILIIARRRVSNSSLVHPINKIILLVQQTISRISTEFIHAFYLVFTRRESVVPERGRVVWPDYIASASRHATRSKFIRHCKIKIK